MGDSELNNSRTAADATTPPAELTTQQMTARWTLRDFVRLSGAFLLCTRVEPCPDYAAVPLPLLRDHPRPVGTVCELHWPSDQPEARKRLLTLNNAPAPFVLRNALSEADLVNWSPEKIAGDAVVTGWTPGASGHVAYYNCNPLWIVLGLLGALLRLDYSVVTQLTQLISWWPLYPLVLESIFQLTRIRAVALVGTMLAVAVIPLLLPGSTGAQLSTAMLCGCAIGLSMLLEQLGATDRVVLLIASGLCIWNAAGPSSNQAVLACITLGMAAVVGGAVSQLSQLDTHSIPAHAAGPFKQFVQESNSSCRYMQASPFDVGLAQRGGTLPQIFDALPRPKTKFVAQRRFEGNLNLRMGLCNVSYAAHFDGTHNLLLQMHGTKSITLMAPKEQPNLYIYSDMHPLRRHSAVIIETPDATQPNAELVQAVRLELLPGDGVVIPEGWVHYVHNLPATHGWTFQDGLHVHRYWMSVNLFFPNWR